MSPSEHPSLAEFDDFQSFRVSPSVKQDQTPKKPLPDQDDVAPERVASTQSLSLSV